MLEKITIKNFKSIAQDTLELGRVNVFIGENGSGKSNILEAFGFASTALVSANIDKEILIGKGVRVAKPSLMVSAFKKKLDPAIEMELVVDGETIPVFVKPESDDIHEAKWTIATKNKMNDFGEELASNIVKSEEKFTFSDMNSFTELIENIYINGEIPNGYESNSKIKALAKLFAEYVLKLKNYDYIKFNNFLIYALNTPALRGFTHESRKEPVGIYGENLDVLLASMSKEELKELTEYQYLIDWLAEFVLDMQDVLKLKGHKLNRSTSKLYFSDKYLKTTDEFFSSENANEGIMHVLFYLAVMISKDTPKFFAIDNIESCLNPHLCRKVAEEICTLAKKHDKQVLITTHNPAVLDGLNLHDDEIRLFVVERNKQGHTKTRRVQIKPENGEANGRQLKLSELWMRGYLGGISSNF